ncbi:MAG: ABC transporter permease [Saccharofermentans sp.]|nr:ABC transporter permease [Saccharofermentans sp.]
MGKVFLRRAARDLKAGASRYLALSLLIGFSMFIVLSLMGSALTVIDYTKIRDDELRREDGEFTVFIPLTEGEIDEIESTGVTVDPMFYIDCEMSEGKILRVYKIRDDLNQMSIVEGAAPSTDEEVLLERRFAEVNGINPGDEITLGDETFTVSGIGATPDYNTVLRNFSDAVVDSASFGVLFVTEEKYDQMLSSGNYLSTEQYCYAYLLNDSMTDDELRELLEEYEIDPQDIQDEYFTEYWDRMTNQRDDLVEGIDELVEGVSELRDGASDLSNGAEELYDGVSELHDGISELNDNVPEFTDGIDELNDGASELMAGVQAYTDAVGQASEGAEQLAQGAALAGVPVDQQSLAAGFEAITAGGEELEAGVAALHDGTSELSDAAGELEDGVSELYDGSSELRDGAEELSDGASELNDGVNELYDGINEFSDEANDMIDDIFNVDTDNLISFITATENPRVDSAADDVQINLSASIIFGVLLIMLFAYVISVFIVHTIDKESPVIGALYSMGVKRSTLTLSYVAVPVLVCFLSGIIGTLVALYTPLGIPSQLQDTLNYFSMPVMEIKVSPFVVGYGLLIPPVTAFVINVLVIRKRLKATPLSLLRSEKKAAQGKQFNIRGLRFLDMFRVRQMVREGRSTMTVVLGLFLTLLIAFMALNTCVYCLKVKTNYADETKFEYMYTYKYPTEEVPEGGYEAVSEELKKTIYGYSFDVAVMGITPDNPFFDIGDVTLDSTNVAVSSSFAVKFDLDVGDEFNVSDKNGERLYAFRVASVVDFSASNMVFMDIDDCRDMFGEDDDYYNVVFSDHELDIESGRLYSTLSRSDLVKAGGIYVDQMMSMIIIMSVASAVMFVVVLYLMMKMMLDRSSFNISLVKIFGFRNREVRQMYLDGNLYIVAIGALLAIPVDKAVMDYIYPRYLISNVGVGIRPSYSPALYVAIFAVIMVLYLLINTVLVARIRKMDPAEVLKNRE